MTEQFKTLAYLVEESMNELYSDLYRFIYQKLAKLYTQCVKAIGTKEFDDKYNRLIDAIYQSPFCNRETLWLQKKCCQSF